MLKHEDVRNSVEGVYVEERKAEEALRRSEEKFKNIFESANDCMIFLDVSGRVLDVNKKTLEVYGGSREELLGKHFSRLGVVSPRDIPRLLSAFAGVLTGKKVTLEVCIKNKIGREVYLECLGSITRIEERLVGVLIVARDVTERKQAEEELKRSEEKARNLIEFQKKVIDTAVVWIDLLDAEGNVTLWNRAAELISGFTSEEVVGHKKVWEWLYPDPAYRAKVFAEAKGVIEKGKRGENFNTTIRCKDGTLKTISWHSNNLLDAEGTPAGLIAVGVDITEAEKAQEKVRESEEKYRSLFENARDVIVTFDLKGNVTSINKGAEEYGFKKDEFLGKNMLKFVSKKYWPRLLADLAKIARGKPTEGEIEINTPLGKKISAYRSSPVKQYEKVVGFQTILRDITERKMADEALRESEERLRQLIEYAPDAIYLNDLKGNFIDGNKQAEKLTGYKKEELIGKSMLTVGLLPKRYVPKAAKALMKNILGQKTGPDEFELTRKDGTPVTVEISTFPVKRSGKTEVIGIARDITERKQMEEELKQYYEHLEELVQKRTDELLESEKRYSVLVEEAGDGVVILQDEKIAFANRKALEIAGYSRDEVMGLPFENVVDEKHRQHAMELYTRAMREKVVPITTELDLIAKTGERLPVETIGTIINYQGRPALLVIMRDIRERKRMEAERLRLEKLITIGELATMVGHDLRNPLQSIENATYYLNNELSRLPISPKTAEMLQVVNDSINYADKIIRDLQDFASTKPPTLEKTDINAIVKETLSQIQTPEKIELRTKLDCLPEIRIDRDQMKRVFLNLTTNAIQAMEKGGSLTVSTKKTEGFIEVSFKDTGVGITKENMQKIFTPFFTTRAKGMGMGLPICKRFVEIHGGSIEVESQVGKGTTFTVKLPISQETEVKTSGED